MQIIPVTFSGALDAFCEVREKARREWLEYYGGVSAICSACAGCDKNFCCSQLVLAHPIEGLAIAEQILSGSMLKAPSLEAIARQGAVQHDLYTRFWRPALAAESEEKAQALSNEASRRWYDTGEVCVFNVDGRCSIYERRPIACASYYVQTRCEKQHAYEDKVAQANNEMVMARVLNLADMVSVVILGVEPNTVLLPKPLVDCVAAGIQFLLSERRTTRDNNDKERAQA